MRVRCKYHGYPYEFSARTDVVAVRQALGGAGFSYALCFDELGLYVGVGAYAEGR